MRSEIAISAIVAVAAFSAFADDVHDAFNARRDEILSAGVSTVGGSVYLVGRANSPRNRGDAVGWTKAEENAKWNLGDRHRAGAPWAADVADDEKEAAWLEYRAAHPNRFRVAGLQRVWTRKTPPDLYEVVIAVPAEFVDFAPPTAAELAQAVGVVRERRRLAAEAAQREAEAAERKAGARKILDNGAIRQQQIDEDLAL